MFTILQNFIWLLLICIGLFILLFLFLQEKLLHRSIRSKLLSPMDSSEKYSLKNISTGLNVLSEQGKRIFLFLPLSLQERLSKLVKASGSNCSSELIVGYSFLFSVLFSLTGYFLLGMIADVTFQWVGTLLLFILGFLTPILYLKKKVAKRQQAIYRSLPAFIDYLMISVEAGIGLDLALTRIVTYLQGPVAEEVALTMTDIKYGKAKKEAFQNMASRISIPELSNFITALLSGQQMGVSLTTILRAQGEQIRLMRKQKAQEAAYKIPVKLLFPLVFFIFPQLFIILLGPAMISMIENFF
ncbi:type II secretion system F family protein [Heliorestis convoluta]|uniref:Type II secretion system F family protein n=1 Tax=Heliorestis convoluta TaxID=356322 RepID=A0A5Q2N0N8_9FIRM|nr:type II secretion system F family protein [Heliorestis convoluta]QGG48568.1 type II secretion system F family protein [Heliorestis convoluta]